MLIQEHPSSTTITFTLANVAAVHVLLESVLAEHAAHPETAAICARIWCWFPLNMPCWLVPFIQARIPIFTFLWRILLFSLVTYGDNCFNLCGETTGLFLNDSIKTIVQSGVAQGK